MSNGESRPGPRRSGRFLELKRRFLKDALAEIGELVSLLEDSARSGSRQQERGRCHKISHDLRGTGGSYGFAAITEVAGRIEDGLLDGEPAAALYQAALELRRVVENADRDAAAEAVHAGAEAQPS